MIIQINIPDGDMVDILTDIAATNKLSIPVYAENIVKTFLDNQLRGKYTDVITKKPLTELSTLVGKYKDIKNL